MRKGVATSRKRAKQAKSEHPLPLCARQTARSCYLTKPCASFHWRSITLLSKIDLQSNSVFMLILISVNGFFYTAHITNSCE